MQLLKTWYELSWQDSFSIVLNSHALPEKVIVEGKDAARVKEIVNTNKNAFAYFKSETEIEMYNNVMTIT